MSLQAFCPSLSWKDGAMRSNLTHAEGNRNHCVHQRLYSQEDEFSRGVKERGSSWRGILTQLPRTLSKKSLKIMCQWIGFSMLLSANFNLSILMWTCSILEKKKNYAFESSISMNKINQVLMFSDAYKFNFKILSALPIPLPETYHNYCKLYHPYIYIFEA